MKDADSLAPPNSAGWTSLAAPAALAVALLLLREAAVWAIAHTGLAGDVALRLTESAVWLAVSAR